jgi:Uma2 family endonuclease
MSTTTEYATTPVPLPLEVPGPVTRVPSLDEIQRLTSIPDRRVVFRGVNWSFYEQLVESIPERSNIHVDYDGRDLEVMAKGPDHEDANGLLGLFVSMVAAELTIPCKGLGETTWKRPDIHRGLESDQCFYFQPEKLAVVARVRGSKNIADYPNPDLAIEADISRPAVDRAGIYAALEVTEVWRFEGQTVIIERLTSSGRYVAVDASGYLPVTAQEVRRWIVEEDTTDESAWLRRLQAAMRKKARRLRRQANRAGDGK